MFTWGELDLMQLQQGYKNIFYRVWRDQVWFHGKGSWKAPMAWTEFRLFGSYGRCMEAGLLTDIENSIVFQRGDQDDFGRKKSLCVDPTFFSSSKLYYYKGYIHILRFSLGYLNGELN